ncbi:helix-turn-helix domain-containing protein [Pseudonocardia broussonetiae]|uniref:Helix-turn-helix domain containing protein n=1 Tax=Pseudonocardia broussonetiae TaxID=2736640 RepID=A0A6M6JK43_9PSEU|nr:helix-turn-helix domain-containing protein [Pseudonocardia broussonetiae]QJY46711.1 helix-turn-helix domain containing protein [Pseudonocardia broussonetiae]
MRTTAPLRLGATDAAALRAWAETGSAGSSGARRARIVLLSAEGHGPAAIAAELGCSPGTVLTWRERYRSDGLPGLRDAPRAGRPVTVDPVAVVERTLRRPPPGTRRWSSRLLADHLGISNVAVAKVWRCWGLAPLDDGHVRLATRPPLDAVPAAFAALHADAAVAVLALLADDRADDDRADDDGADDAGIDDGPAPAPTPLRSRPRLGARFGGLDLGASADPPAGVLARLDAVPSARLRLLVSGATAPVEHWAALRGVPVHATAGGVEWARFVRVAAVLAGATADGAASVADLRRAVLDHVPGAPLRWSHGAGK